MIKVAPKAQTKCPVTGKKINKAHFVDVLGYRIYLSKKRHGRRVRKYPARYLAVLAKRNEKAEKLPPPKKETKTSKSPWW